jgi:hypothetical protein
MARRDKPGDDEPRGVLNIGELVMRSLPQLLAVLLSICALSAHAADTAPVGAWRTTSGCFMLAFILTDGGRAQAVYMTGEEDENAAWTWDGTTLKITSKMFDLDMFSAHLANDELQADYVWHDLDNDKLNTQACTFERFTPFGI